MSRVGRRRTAALAGAAGLGLLLVGGSRPAEARRLFVPAPHRTIQAAVDSAASGDTIWVKAGVYRGAIRIVGKTLVLFGDGGPEETILDGGDSVRVLHVEGVRGGSIIGFTLRKGRAPVGGGIFLLRDTSYTVTSCVVRDNWEGGIAAWSTLGLVLSDSEIRDNRGSGLLFDHSDNAFVFSNRFVGNTAHVGGGISLVASKILYPMKDCVFERNKAEGSVGGAVSADSSHVQFAKCTFAENTSAVAGGAVAAMGASRLAVGGSRFRENRAAQSGAVHADHSGLHISLSIFDKNHAGVAGAAVGILGREAPNVNPMLTRNTFYKNTTDQEGGAIFCLETSPEITKNIFVVEGANKAVFGPGTSPRFDCNLIHDPTGAGLATLPSANTLVGDPLFCDPEKGDFKVRDLSVAVLAACGPVGAEGKGCPTFQPIQSR